MTFKGNESEERRLLEQADVFVTSPEWEFYLKWLDRFCQYNELKWKGKGKGKAHSGQAMKAQRDS